jgi:hypothetical protein
MRPKKTHCHRGHPYSGDNLIIKRDGSRDCRECDRARQRKWRTTHKEKAAERQRKWRAANLEKVRKRQRESNRRWYAEHPDKQRENVYRWRKNNPERWREINRRSHAKRRAELHLIATERIT